MFVRIRYGLRKFDAVQLLSRLRRSKSTAKGRVFLVVVDNVGII